MPLSADPVKRQRQVSNLKYQAALTSGAYSETEIAPLRAELHEILLERFTSTPPELLWVMANRWARLQKLTAFIDDVGPLKANREMRSPAVELGRLEGQFERQWIVLEERERALVEGADPHASLAAIVAEIGEGGES